MEIKTKYSIGDERDDDHFALALGVAYGALTTLNDEVD